MKEKYGERGAGTRLKEDYSCEEKIGDREKSKCTHQVAAAGK